MELLGATTLKKMDIKEDEDFWRKQLEEFKSSQLTRAAYCRQSELNYDRFGFWYKRLQKNPLVPIKIKSKMTSTLTPLCTVTLNNGCCLQIHDIQALSFILERLA